MPSAPTITFEPGPSRLLLTMVAAVALSAMLAVVLARMPWWLKIVLCTAVPAYAWHGLRHHLRQPVRHAAWQGDGTWVLRLADATEVHPRLAGARVLGPMIFLYFSWSGGGRTSLALLPDNADADTRRRLRVRLSALSDRS